jgi:hypothetical protein
MIWLADIIGASGRFRSVRAKFMNDAKTKLTRGSEPIHLFSLGALVTVDHAQFLANADAIAEQSFLFRSREIYEIGKRPINQ